MFETSYFVAILLSLGAAVSAAVNQLCIRIGTDEGEIYDAVFVVMATNLLVLVPLVLLYYYPAYGLTGQSWVSFIAAGLVGTLLGRILLYTSIARIGASRSSPIIASNALIATIFGAILLNEPLTSTHAASIVLIVCGVAVIAWETGRENPNDLSVRKLIIGLLIPILAAIAYGLEPIFANFGFAEGTPAAVGLMIKTVTATVGFVVYLRWQNSLPNPTIVYSRDIQWFVLAGISNTLFLLSYYIALAIAP